jgi:CBS domain-containing protein
VADLLQHRGEREPISVSPDATVSEVIGTMKMHGISQVPVLEDGQAHRHPV